MLWSAVMIQACTTAYVMTTHDMYDSVLDPKVLLIIDWELYIEQVSLNELFASKCDFCVFKQLRFVGKCFRMYLVY